MHPTPDPSPRPAAFRDEVALDDWLSRPTSEVIDLFRRLRGDLVVLGSGGKMGASLVAMACRARDAAGRGDATREPLRVYSVSRFSDVLSRAAQEAAGAVTIACDLLDDDAVARLPRVDNVIYMVGLKFGTSDNPAMTWAVNTLAPAAAARRYGDARIVVFSTGCVYDLSLIDSGGSVESDPLTPIGEYSNACVARERVFEHFSRTQGTPIAMMRLNYALEPRYGVLVDLAQHIARGEPIDVTMGHFNGIWQGDANAAALRLLEHATSPPSAFNVTGAATLRVRDVATRLAERMGRDVTFLGDEAPTALLSNASKTHALLGAPPTPIDRVIDWVADWVANERRLLGKPTHFQTRDGKY